MSVAARRLPHLYAIGQPLFVTFRIHNSLPSNRAFPAKSLTSGEAFVAMDRLLDHARTGPLFLKQPEVAEEVLSSIDRGVETGHYDLHAWVIMPNHVHLLFTPKINVARLLNSLKSASARRANLLLKRTGQPFWQDESYDHLIRNRDEFGRVKRYIENNPVKAGLAATPEGFLWSSAGRPVGPPQAEGLPHKL
jgi:REP element-mobilizing transposase RayT